MSNYAAVVQRIEDERGVRAVVLQADEVIWLTDELMAEASNPDRPQMTGGLEWNGDLITLGTVGEGLGRLTYRLIGHDGARGFYIAKRKPEPTEGAQANEVKPLP